MSDQEEKDIDAPAKTIYGEARGESEEGKYAVAHTVRNRQESKKPWLKGNTIEETCKKPKQFSCWNDNDVNRKKLQNVTPEYREIAKNVIQGRHQDNTGGATHYYSDSLPKPPSWAKSKTSSAVIGHHKFFNNID